MTGSAGGGGTTGAAGTDSGLDTTTDVVAGTDGSAGASVAGADGGAAGSDGAAGATTDGGAGTDADAADAADATDTATPDAGTDAEDAGDATDGACQNACTLNALQCGAGGGTQTCVMDGDGCTSWGTEVACGNHTVCGVSGGTVACGCQTTSCTAAGDFCSSATDKTTCAVDGVSGCLFVTAGPTACPTHETCSGQPGAGVCACAVDPSCASGTDTLCASTTSQSNCAEDTNHCFYVAQTNSCGANQTCTGSKPSGACTCNAAPAQCTADGVTFCDGSGNSVTCHKDTQGCYTTTTTNCGSHQTCNGSGVCQCNASACSVNGTFCDGSGKLVTCATDVNSCVYESAGPTSCTANETCTGASPTAACTCNAAPANCTGGAAGTFCTGNSVTTCTADAHQCVTIASVSACGTHQTCGGTTGSNACTCNTPPAGCTGNGTFCASTGTQETCTVDANNCPFAQTPVPCPTHETCKGSTLGNTCTCDDTCTAGQSGGSGTYCVDSATQASCTADSNSCHISSANATCLGLQTCRTTTGANGACQCPVAGTTIGTGCTTPGTTICTSSTVVLTCTHDAAGGCNTWQAPVDCGASGLVCGTKSTVAACQCPDHTGTDYIVDQGQGTSTTSNVFSTGISSPVECRFPTLKAGLAAATTAGNRVVATSTGGTTTFVNETYPLAVSAGVTLTTTDSVPTPANFVISFNGAGSAVSLANSTTFEGFTVANNGGTASASAVSVTGTGVTIDTVDLEGTGGTKLANGISVTGAGVALMNDVAVDGFTTGINFGTSSTTSQLNNSSITSNTTGLAISNGTLTASTDTVSGGTTGISISGPGSSLPAFSGTSVKVSGASGAGISQTSSGGTPTLTLTSGEITGNGAGGIVSASGTVTLASVNVHANTGSGVSVSAGTASIGATGAALIQSNTVKGINLTGGTLTVGAVGVGSATVSGNGSDGLFASAGTATINAGHFDSNTGAGMNIGTTLTIGGSATAPVTASSNTGDGINVTAGTTTANYLTLNANGTGTTKASGLEITGPAALSLGVATDAALTFSNNGLHGINVNGTSAASVLDVRKVQSTGNGSDGIAVDVNNGTTVIAGAGATFTTCTVSGNSNQGVEVFRAPIAGSTRLTFDGLTASNNTGSGVYFRGNTGSIGVLLKNSTISSNGGIGLRVEETLALTVTTETIQNCNIFSNGSHGVAFNTQSTLSSFAGNQVHGNAGDQISVAARETGNGTWGFNSPTGTMCDASRNQVYCYKNGNVGIRVQATPGTTVNAENVSWNNTAPSNNVDYFVPVPALGNSLDATAPCPASPNACP